MLNVILCGYRDWALKVNNYVASLENIHCVEFITSKDQYDKSIYSKFIDKIDFILFVGWSWIIDDDILEKYLCLGIHPSDLPYYRGGTPIQHQIIKGIKNTKITLMSLSSDKIDAGDIYAKEDVLLTGNNMHEVLDSIAESSKKMLSNFIKNYYTITPIKQNIEKGTYFKRRTPKESRLTLDNVATMTLEQLYDFIRALTDPYPNAYMEDTEGNRLLFKAVEYLHKEN
jgi:methionyl-tRNA formyltransferase